VNVKGPKGSLNPWVPGHFLVRHTPTLGRKFGEGTHFGDFCATGAPKGEIFWPNKGLPKESPGLEQKNSPFGANFLTPGLVIFSEGAKGCSKNFAPQTGGETKGKLWDYSKFGQKRAENFTLYGDLLLAVHGKNSFWGATPNLLPSETRNLLNACF